MRQCNKEFQMIIKMYTVLCIFSIFSAREVLATAKVRNLLKITAENGVFLVGNFILIKGFIPTNVEQSHFLQIKYSLFIS